jgi:Uma2 family endonuclease
MTASTLERVSATSWLPQPDALGFTAADLHALPDDGLRHELIDGSLIVSPSPTTSHNLIARWVARELEDSCPDKKWVVGTDQSASINERNEPRPDIVVLRTEHMTRSPFPIVDASLVVEVVSPNSGLRDTELKRVAYARAGVPAYWIIDPDEGKGVISLAELRLDGKAYRYETHYTANVFETMHPWPVRIDLPAISQRWAEYLEMVE